MNAAGRQGLCRRPGRFPHRPGHPPSGRRRRGRELCGALWCGGGGFASFLPLPEEINLQAILWLPFPLMAGFALLAALLCLGAGLALVFLLRYLKERLPERLPQPAFISVTATAWALSLGFAASDVFSLNSMADQAAQTERSSISRIMGMVAPEALDMPDMYQTMTDYVGEVMAVEWSQNHNRHASPRADDLLQSLRLQIIAMTGEDVPEVLISKTINDFDALQDARNIRLALGQSVVDETRWYLVFALSLLTALNIGLVHANAPKAARNALVVYSTALFMCLVILGITADPYRTMNPALLITKSADALTQPAPGLET